MITILLPKYIMIWWIISTFLSGFATIFRKKSMNFRKDLWDYGFMFIGWLAAIFLFPVFFFRGDVGIEAFSLKNIWIIAGICVLWFVSNSISQYVYKNEKISLIAPYENLDKILSIIFSFFIFSDVSVISLVIAIFVILIIFATSIDLKQMKIPKTIQVFSINQLIVSINTILIGYLLLYMSSIEYFVLENGIWILMLLCIIVFNKDIIRLKKQPKEFFQNRFGAAIAGTLAYILSLYIISSFGVTINILLSFLYLGFILVLSYMMLWDIPSKKSIIVSIVVTLLVWLGFYFK